MTTTFEDNIEVTLSDLNNVAVDLGYTDFSAFSNEKFGVDQLNQITSDLVSAGVLRTGTDGTVGCEVIASDGVAYVQPGVIVFASGAKIRITQPEAIDLVAGTYIYAIADSTIGTAKLEVSDTEPTGDYVMLAVVDAEGTLLDRRSISVAKVDITANQQNKYQKITAIVEGVQKGTKGVTIDIGNTSFSYVLVEKVIRINGSTTIARVPSYNNAKHLEDGVSSRIDVGKYEGNVLNSVYFEKDGQCLKISISDTSGDKLDFEINIIVM